MEGGDAPWPYCSTSSKCLLRAPPPPSTPGRYVLYHKLGTVTAKCTAGCDGRPLDEMDKVTAVQTRHFGARHAKMDGASITPHFDGSVPEPPVR